MMEESAEKKEHEEKQKNHGVFSALSLVTEIGVIISLPLVMFGLLGRFADKKFNSYPWFLLLGCVVSLAISSFLVYKKVSKINKE